MTVDILDILVIYLCFLKYFILLIIKILIENITIFIICSKKLPLCVHFANNCGILFLDVSGLWKKLFKTVI